MEAIISAQVEVAPARETLRDRRGAVIGYIEGQHLTKRIIGRDKFGVIVGTYDPRRNETRDARGRRIGTGNLLPAMIMRP